MKNAIKFKDTWLAKNSKAYELYVECKSAKEEKPARKKFEDHMKEVNTKYEKSLQD